MQERENRTSSGTERQSDKERRGEREEGERLEKKENDEDERKNMVKDHMDRAMKQKRIRKPKEEEPSLIYIFI